MKVAVLIARILLGLIFVVFGLNAFLHFLPSPPPPGAAGQFAGLLFTTHYYIVVFALQFIGGVLLLVGRYIPLALVILGPIIVNILLFHIHMAPSGIGPGLVATVLWFIVFAAHRESFRGILSANG
ncbi:MAG: DoxX family membrane protein [Acidobacteriaceae bacterium]|jgi:putative oxidoreductase